MLQIQIPDAYFSGFESLLSLSPEQIDQIAAALKSVNSGTGPNSFSEELSGLIPDNIAGKQTLLQTIFSFGSFQPTKADEAFYTELTLGLVHSFKEKSQGKRTEEELKQLQSYLVTIFNSLDRLRTTFKAYTLLAENERVFRTGHIVTDIRLLFKDDLKIAERCGLVLHQLKMEAEEDGDTVAYYFLLNKTDLESLRDQINRALEKEELIRNDYKDISFITITE